MEKKLASITRDVIEDVGKLRDMGVAPDKVIEGALHMAGIRWQREGAKGVAINNLVEALIQVDQAFTDDDAGISIGEQVADLDLSQMSSVSLNGVIWERAQDGFWRPANPGLAEGAPYPFDDAGLMAWFKQHS